MRRLVASVLGVAAIALVSAYGCGEAPDRKAPIPDEAYDLIGAGGGSGCTFFPDSCPAGEQCYTDARDNTRTLCSDPGQKGLGEDCDNTTGNRADFCLPNLACITYGSGASAQKQCTPLCNDDADCDDFAGGGGAGGAGGAGGSGIVIGGTCTTLPQGSLKICPIQ